MTSRNFPPKKRGFAPYPSPTSPGPARAESAHPKKPRPFTLAYLPPAPRRHALDDWPAFTFNWDDLPPLNLDDWPLINFDDWPPLNLDDWPPILSLTPNPLTDETS